MNHEQFTQIWVQIAMAELKRRKKVLQKFGPKKYMDLFGKNSMCYKENCPSHVWVPATHLWIFDGGKTPRMNYYQWGPASHRSFREANVRAIGEELIFPRLCFNCGAWSEHVTENKTRDQKIVEIARYEKERDIKRKGKRGRRGQGPTITSLEELGL